MRRVLVVAVCVLLSSACSGNKSPTAPSSPNPGSPTRIIALTGSLNFGAVTLNTSSTASFTIANQGTAVLTVSGLSGPCGAQFTAGFTNGPIAPNASQPVTVRYSPTTLGNCSGTLTVSADHTSGSNTLPVTASATLDGVPFFTRSGTGNSVFDIPTYITRVRIQADYGERSSNFVVRIAGRLVVNELLGTTWSQTHYDGSHLINGGTVEISNSSGVAWSILELR